MAPSRYHRCDPALKAAADYWLRVLNRGYFLAVVDGTVILSSSWERLDPARVWPVAFWLGLTDRDAVPYRIMQPADLVAELPQHHDQLLALLQPQPSDDATLVCYDDGYRECKRDEAVSWTWTTVINDLILFWPWTYKVGAYSLPNLAEKSKRRSRKPAAPSALDAMLEQS